MCKIFGILTILILLMSSTEASDVAKRFTRKSIAIQLDLATIVVNSTKDNVYVYTYPDYFTDAVIDTVDNIRVAKKNGKVAVQSGAAEAVFISTAHYRQYANRPLCEDSIGLYLGYNSK